MYSDRKNVYVIIRRELVPGIVNIEGVAALPSKLSFLASRLIRSQRASVKRDPSVTCIIHVRWIV